MKKEEYAESIVAKIKKNRVGNVVTSPMEIISLFSSVPDSMKEEVFNIVERRLNEG